MIFDNRGSSGAHKDADVIVLNKVEVNEKSIGQAKNLKLVCVTATGTNNLDKEYLAKEALNGEMSQGILQRLWRSYICTAILSA